MRTWRRPSSPPAEARPPARSHATLDRLFHAYLAWFSREAAAGSRSGASLAKSYSPKWCLHLQPHLGHCQLWELSDGRVVNKLYADMLSDGCRGRPISQAMVYEVHKVLSAALGWGVEHGWLTRAEDPRRKINVPSAYRTTEDAAREDG